MKDLREYFQENRNTRGRKTEYSSKQDWMSAAKQLASKFSVLEVTRVKGGGNILSNSQTGEVFGVCKDDEIYIVKDVEKTLKGQGYLR